MSNFSRYNINPIDLSRTNPFRGRMLYPDIIVVHEDSCFLHKKALEQCAKYFQREGYSNWTHFGQDDVDFVGFLFTDNHYSHAIGGCLFRKRKYENIPSPFWVMHWAWIHPFARNRGILSKHVEYFNDRFKYWYPEPPHSQAMEAFIDKHKIMTPFERFNLTKINTQ